MARAVLKTTLTDDTRSETVPLHDYFTISISNSWGGSIDLQRSFDQGATWSSVLDSPYTANTEANGLEPLNTVLYSVIGSGLTGTADIVLGN